LFLSAWTGQQAVFSGVGEEKPPKQRGILRFSEEFCGKLPLEAESALRKKAAKEPLSAFPLPFEPAEPFL